MDTKEAIAERKKKYAELNELARNLLSSGSERPNNK